ncbi:MAG: LysM peptidoglycan-binding domain-containing protein [Deltaproteobacteria bacterium]|nr:LysM peptidoglycan-binding domain-containing protein [Deltaproteobacteria bacterium]
MRLPVVAGIRGCFLLLLLGSFLVGSSAAQTQPLTHKVEKGDTLWSICEKYYGDAGLWPKLWEMNPFVTNPHLIRPGDVIKLIETEPLKPKMVETPKAPPQPTPVVKVEPKRMGIRTSAFANANARGYLTGKEVEPWGRVFTTDSNAMLLVKGDTLFVDFGEREGIKAGDHFGVFRPSTIVKHPITEKEFGRVLSSQAKIVVKERAKKNIYRVEILESYSDTKIDDVVLPFVAIPPCLKPLPSDPKLRGVVVAEKDLQNAFGQGSIVYLDCGAEKGLRNGMILEIMRFKNLPDPDIKGPFPENLLFGLLGVKTFEEFLEKLTRESTLYEKVVGYMMVLESRADTATALVLSTKEQLYAGAFFRGIASWGEAPESLRSIFSCAVE